MWFLKISVLFTIIMHIRCAVLKSEETTIVNRRNELINVEPASQNNVSIKTDLKSVNYSLEIIPRSGGKKKGHKKQDLMSKILPMLAIPFLVSSSMIPMMLTSLKVMLLKSMFIGKMAILLLALNALWKINNQGGVYSHNINLDNDHKMVGAGHYGYNQGDEYGAYVNKRRK